MGIIVRPTLETPPRAAELPNIPCRPFSRSGRFATAALYTGRFLVLSYLVAPACSGLLRFILALLMRFIKEVIDTTAILSSASSLGQLGVVTRAGTKVWG